MLHVMRLTGGAKIELFDGNGNVAEGVVEKTTRKSLVVTTGNVTAIDRELSIRLVVGVALPRGDRTRFLVEKLTELGVTRLVPLTTARATAKPGDGTVEKLTRYVIEASKQCGRNQLMQVQSATRIEDFLDLSSVCESAFLLHPESSVALSAGDVRASGSVAICVGPEGGWTENELQMITDAGWQSRCLGARILRTETAAIVLASVLSTLAEKNA